MKVPLIPFERPMPEVLKKRAALALKAKPKDKPKEKKMPKAKSKLKFVAFNTESLEDKPDAIGELWELISAMDPSGELFVNDIGLVVVEGAGDKNRTPKALSFTKEQKELVNQYAILDSEEEDDPATAKGRLFTVYQLVEASFDLGASSEREKLTSVALAAAVDPDDDDDDFEDDDEDEYDDEDDEE